MHASNSSNTQQHCFVLLEGKRDDVSRCASEFIGTNAEQMPEVEQQAGAFLPAATLFTLIGSFAGT